MSFHFQHVFVLIQRVCSFIQYVCIFIKHVLVSSVQHVPIFCATCSYVYRYLFSMLVFLCNMFAFLLFAIFLHFQCSKFTFFMKYVYIFNIFYETCLCINLICSSFNVTCSYLYANCFYCLPNASAVMSQVTTEYLVDNKLFR